MLTLNTKGNCGPRKKIKCSWRRLDSVWTHPNHSRDIHIGPNKKVNKNLYTFDKRNVRKKCNKENLKTQGWLKTYQKIHRKRKQGVHIINIRQKVSRELTLNSTSIQGIKHYIKLYTMVTGNIRRKDGQKKYSCEDFNKLPLLSH